MRIKNLIFLLVILLLVSNFNLSNIIVYASDNYLDTDVYTVYDENFNVLFEKDAIQVGDNYLSKDYKFYEIVYVDDSDMKGIAKFVRNVPRPNIDISYAPKPIEIEDRVICMYMTHNDESYLPTDGVDSIYGNGGIKDVAVKFKEELEKRLVDVYLDDTLHIPHDTKAYSRSLDTARSLKNKYNPDALFDIHRDGASRKFYVTNVNGVERGRVRMVIGKANSNMAINEEFAMYLMAVGNELYPWLFTDIYYANGHYNQSLDGKAILFEMGSHLVEKDLVLDSMPELAEVVTTALYNTTVNDTSGELTINGTENSENIIVNELIDAKESSQINILSLTIGVVVIAFVSVYAFIMIYKTYKNPKKIRNK